jgi:hypothetical protein
VIVIALLIAPVIEFAFGATENVTELNFNETQPQPENITNQPYECYDEMFKITLENGSKLLVSPEHKVYGMVLDKDSINSEVENTLTRDCCFNPLSLDQMGQLSFNANAAKSTSSGSGIADALSINEEYSSNGINSTSIASSFLNF